MTVVYLLLLALAAFCFALSTFGKNVGPDGRALNLLPLGLLFWVLVPLLQTFQALD